MAGKEVLLGALERNWTMVDTALAGLSDADVSRRPGGDADH